MIVQDDENSLVELIDGKDEQWFAKQVIYETIIISSPCKREKERESNKSEKEEEEEEEEESKDKGKKEIELIEMSSESTRLLLLRPMIAMKGSKSILRADNTGTSSQDLSSPHSRHKKPSKRDGLMLRNSIFDSQMKRVHLRARNTQEVFNLMVKEEGLVHLHKLDADIFELVSKGNIKELKLLYRKGQDLNIINYDTRNLLHIACCGDNLAMIQWLVEHNVNINLRDCQLQTPLYEAMRVGKPEIIKFLKDNGAVSVSGFVGSKFCELGSKGDVQGLHKLIKTKEDLSIGDYDSRTALHLACCEGQFECVQWLVRHGSDINARDRFGNTPLHDAIRYNHTDIKEFLENFTLRK
ncbi:hypothetical protein RFI_19189 [Reticulomyxa filosa]|uniref:Uncharacterized protein n=1 Tax=Reticulomyxa filosa TaxID=46433 RepID=X6MWT1_RETFI|nr:hypothetical protein RFI_19189 [Reticulomyxa filosa]|eukprot:ETO18101.1 hypothetical protein RFI_19189 [Reticulomyxa filosa]